MFHNSTWSKPSPVHVAHTNMTIQVIGTIMDGIETENHSVQLMLMSYDIIRIAKSVSWCIIGFQSISPDSSGQGTLSKSGSSALVWISPQKFSSWKISNNIHSLSLSTFLGWGGDKMAPWWKPTTLAKCYKLVQKVDMHSSPFPL